MANQTPAAGTDIVLVADDNALLSSKIGDYLAWRTFGRWKPATVR